MVTCTCDGGESGGEFVKVVTPVRVEKGREGRCGCCETSRVDHCWLRVGLVGHGPAKERRRETHSDGRL